MRVITLTDTEFKRHCRLLEQIVRESGCAFDAVVAIARGGAYVADGFRLMQGERRFTVKAQRGSTGWKRGYAWILRRLPGKVNDWLRVIEAHILRRFRHTHDARPAFELPQGLVQYMQGGSRSVLVVDDAIDSGCTMLAVVNALKGVSEAAHIFTAVITVTTGTPVIAADFCIYNDGTLVRFPWSLDFGMV